MLTQDTSNEAICQVNFYVKAKKVFGFVKHIGKGVQKVKAGGEVLWAGCWSGGYGQQAALQSY